MKLQISRQYLNDLSSYFLPFMLKAADAHIQSNAGSETELYARVCKSILQDIDVCFKRKILTTQQKFKISFKEADAIIFVKFMLQFPIPADHFWRHNLRNQVIEQLDKQLA